MGKHRPGPWILSEYEVRHPITLELRNGCEIFCNRNNKVIAEIPDYCFHPEDVDQDRADARLITAAPELLDALEQIASYPSLDAQELMRIARAAIAKAAS